MAADEDFQSAAAFPQRSIIAGSKDTSNPTTEATQRQDGPNFFRDAENVQFHFAANLCQFERSGNAATFQIHTIGQLNRTTQTHDTVMHQFLEQPENKGSMLCKVSFHSPYIFRVSLAQSGKNLNDINDDPEFPPPGARMHSGKPAQIQFQVEEFPEYVALKTSAIEVRAYRSPFNLQAHWQCSKVPFWSQRRSDLFTSDIVPTSLVTHENRNAVFEAFALRSGERIFGLGERFDSVNRLGRKVDFVNHDAIGTSNTRTYINVPFFWSTAGYGCFVNHTARTEFDMAASEQGTVGLCAEERWLDYFVVAGRNPKELLARYTQDLTGTAPQLPPWTFGLWLSRNSYHSWNVVDEIVEKCDSLAIPLDTVHLDTFWFRQNWNPDYVFDEKRFASPDAKMAQYKKAGIHVSLWSYHCAPPREDNSVYLEGLKGGFFATKSAESKELYAYPDGTRGTWTDDAVIDFSNPDAVEWHTATLAHLVRLGASAIKTDFADCVPPHAHYKRIEGRRFQNLYALAYTSSIWKAIRNVDDQAIIWARPGTAGSQRYPVHWGGDSQCSWSGLQGTLKSSLSIGLSGFAYHSHDIGGFIGKPSPELYIRWAQFGLLSSHSRAHGAGDENGREPWYYGADAIAIFRKFAVLKYSLLPYILEQARLGAPKGLPVVRAMILEFPEDRSCWDCEEQYMFGASLLIAPILESKSVLNEKLVYVPKGSWYDFWTKQKLHSSGEWITLQDVPLDSIPLWVRDGAVLPFAKPRLRTYNSMGQIERVECYGQPVEPVIKFGHGSTAFEVDLEQRTVKGASENVSTDANVIFY